MAGDAKNPGDDDPIVLKPEEIASEPDGTAAASADAENLNTIIQEKDKEIAELKDKYLRVLADSENARKRIRQQSEESVRIQKEGLIRDLLPVVDNLERAVGAAQGGGNGKSIVEGVEMVLRSLHDVLRNHGVTQMSVVGQQFDPTRHEAVEQIESAVHQPNTVVEEHHRGYLMGERTLRPARVSVAKSGRSDGNDRDN